MTATALTQELARRFGALPQVAAVALGGSRTGAVPDAHSDIDLYVYTHADIDLAERKAIVAQAGGATKASLGLTQWGPGDEWFDAATGIEVDVVYFDAAWMAAQLRRVIDEHQASLGYSTCFWHTVRHNQILHDPHGWLGALQVYSRHAYPEPLRRNIIAFNHPVLRTVIPAYANQLKKAVARGDWVSVNHRLAGLLASYFDVIFAVNRVLHPGEKQLVARMLASCERLPVGVAADIDAVLHATVADGAVLLHTLERLLDRLDDLLLDAGFDPRTAQPFPASPTAR